MNSREMARRQSSPYTGKFSARPAGQRGGFLRSGEFATMPSPPLFFRGCKEQYWAPSMRFGRHGGIYLVRCGLRIKPKPWGGTGRFPPVGPKPR